MPDRNTDIVWAAGFIDGEGCFSLTRRSGLADYTRDPVLTVVQCSLEPLEKLHDLFGGYLGENGRTLKGTQKWQWRVSGAALVEVAQALLPYLVNKHDVAVSVMEYAKTTHFRGYVFTSKEINQRKKLVKRYETVKAAV